MYDGDNREICERRSRGDSAGALLRNNILSRNPSPIQNHRTLLLYKPVM